MKFFLDHLVNKICGEAQDTIFAFYNLFSRELQAHLPSPSEYRKEPQNLLLRAISAMITSERSLFAITVRSRQNIPIGEKDAWQPDLPSWCPYVRTSFEIGSPSLSGKVSFGNEIAEHSFQNDGKLLRVRGCAVAVVSKVLSPSRHKDLVRRHGDKYSPDEMHHIITYYLECLGFGLQIPHGERDPQENSQETLLSQPFLLESFVQPGFMTISNGTSDGVLFDIGPEYEYEAIRYWRLTKSRTGCKYIILYEGVMHTTSLTGWDNDNANWIDLDERDDAALIPRASDVGDIICGIVGCPLLVVLRALPWEYGMEPVYQVVGEALGTLLSI